MRLVLALLIYNCANWAAADTVMAARTIKAHSVLTAADLRIDDETTPGAASTLSEVVGLESKVVLYAGRPVPLEHLGTPALVGRNDLITLVYVSNGLEIKTEGRALERAGAGDRVNVMNLASRKTVAGVVVATGVVEIRNTDAGDS